MFKSLTFASLAIAATATMASADLSHVSDAPLYQDSGLQIDLGLVATPNLAELLTHSKSTSDRPFVHKKVVPTLTSSWTWALPA